MKEVGDTVTILKSLQPCSAEKMPEGVCVTQQMALLAGTIATIDRVLGDKQYVLKEDSGNWTWTDSMFERVAPIPLTPLQAVINSEIHRLRGIDEHTDI